MWRLEIRLLFALLFARFHFQPKLGVLRGEKQVQREHANRCRLTRLLSSLPGYITGKSSSRIPGCWRFCCDTSFKGGSVLELRSHFKALSGNLSGAHLVTQFHISSRPKSISAPQGSSVPGTPAPHEPILSSPHCSFWRFASLPLAGSRRATGIGAQGWHREPSPNFGSLWLCLAPGGVGKPWLAGKLCWWAAPDERCFKKRQRVSAVFQEERSANSSSLTLNVSDVNYPTEIHTERSGCAWVGARGDCSCRGFKSPGSARRCCRVQLLQFPGASAQRYLLMVRGRRSVPSAIFQARSL